MDTWITSYEGASQDLIRSSRRASLFFLSSAALMNACDLNSASLKLVVWDRRASISAKDALCASSCCRTSSFWALSCSSRAIYSRRTCSASDRRRLAFLIISLAFSILSSGREEHYQKHLWHLQFLFFLSPRILNLKILPQLLPVPQDELHVFEQRGVQAVH